MRRDEAAPMARFDPAFSPPNSKPRAAADPHVLFDHDVRADVDVFREFGGCVDHGGFVDRVGHRLPRATG